MVIDILRGRGISRFFRLVQHSVIRKLHEKHYAILPHQDKIFTVGLSYIQLTDNLSLDDIADIGLDDGTHT